MLQSNELRFQYRNWKGRIEWRIAIPKNIEFKSTEWHPVPQWIMSAYDVEKKAMRDFAMKDMMDVDFSAMQHNKLPIKNIRKHKVACG